MVEACPVGSSPSRTISLKATWVAGSSVAGFDADSNSYLASIESRIWAVVMTSGGAGKF